MHSYTHVHLVEAIAFHLNSLTRCYTAHEGRKSVSLLILEFCEKKTRKKLNERNENMFVDDKKVAGKLNFTFYCSRKFVSSLSMPLSTEMRKRRKANGECFNNRKKFYRNTIRFIDTATIKSSENEEEKIHEFSQKLNQFLC